MYRNKHNGLKRLKISAHQWWVCGGSSLVHVSGSWPSWIQFLKKTASEGLNRKKGRLRRLSASADTNPLLSQRRMRARLRQPSERLTYGQTHTKMIHRLNMLWFCSASTCVTQLGVSKAEDAAICSIYHRLNHLGNRSRTHLRLATGRQWWENESKGNHRNLNLVQCFRSYVINAKSDWLTAVGVLSFVPKNWRFQFF